MSNMDKLQDWGWNAFWEAQADEFCREGLSPARVTGHGRDTWIVQGVEGQVNARHRSRKRREIRPVVGDWVSVEPGPSSSDPWTLHEVFPRRTKISRGAAGKNQIEQVLAANIDTIWIVHGLDTELNLRKLERYLSVAWDSGAIPEIVMTKTDLNEDLDAIQHAVADIAAGVDIHYVNNFDPESTQMLSQKLQAGKTICLLGPSGVGKSTLINGLAQEALTQTGEVRSGDSKGRHTTTHRELYRISKGVCLLDTPGIRELKLWSADEGVSVTFPEIESLAESCRFRDCKHDTEPGCAVREAVESGALSEERFASFQKLQAELAFERRKADPHFRAAAISEFKAISKSMKYHSKYKNDDPS